MKLVGITVFIGLLAIIVNCSTPETAVVSKSIGSTNQEVDSLELARKNRVDSVSQITKPSTAKPQTIIGAPKAVKKRTENS